MSSTQTTQVPIKLSFESIDDLIYDARSGDLDALKTDIASLSKQHDCSESLIVASAIDMEPESEGGTGSCLLHFPAANGNLEILSYLLQILYSSSEFSAKKSIVNHGNHSGNTPLHWAALNTHLECVKALVAAGADISIKNDAGHDAVFLAERTAWTAEGEGDETQEQKEQDESEGGEEDKGKISPGRAVVEWLLGCEKGDSLETSARDGSESASAFGNASGEAMDGVEETK
ncbi:hypothetical protein MPDQ_002967 [Monascus purpureus]|uniref:Uncharacterized protein n=1 Tax=Monascus purpureus TaxID=5098 RepID=A0A507R7Q9_MONPU|nr:hypothetical protein MPDQ_002967 [Monascus purpureus]BDD59473.1 hypothetical protein MAP00_004680 [Monascus purpureus]